MKNVKAWQVQTMWIKLFFAFVIAGIVMAILVPAMHTRGVTLQGWMVWGVIAASVAVCMAPDIRRWWVSRPR
jgi:hypothetical protein